MALRPDTTATRGGRGQQDTARKRHHRAGPCIDDLAAHAEIAEHAFERGGVILQHLGADGGAAALARRRQQFERRQNIAAAGTARFRRPRLSHARRGFGVVGICLVVLDLGPSGRRETRLVAAAGHRDGVPGRRPLPAAKQPRQSRAEA